MSESRELLRIEQLHLEVRPRRGAESIPILRGVSLSVKAGESVGIVGESGSGKSMTTRAIMQLLPDAAEVSGSISYQGDEMLGASRARVARFRQSEVGMIYQDPRAHINRLWTVGDFVTEAVVSSGAMRPAAARARALELFAEVGISDGERRFGQYPHQLSGGLLQRVMIVAALMTDPMLIIADEATTALDVTVQADVMGVFADLRERHGVSLLFITHDLDLAVAVTDTIVVMYAGAVVETGPAAHLYDRPRHPYTAALLQSRPDPHVKRRLVSIPGRPTSAAEVDGGCAFAARCAFATDLCRVEEPELRELDGRLVACHRAEAISDDLIGAGR